MARVPATLFTMAIFLITEAHCDRQTIMTITQDAAIGFYVKSIRMRGFYF